ncbi:hypothetical protein ADL29_38985 [Streptomyces chattanoogensis]|uniref:2-methylisocitrate lyase n=1 Tax=Streptomyces chattanoogensis TaxID=66876 RepID=A0A0N0XQ92_9ACTN|nr:hypothetical protein ADL29_38985 [Streptomyces chattanoogensis]
MHRTGTFILPNPWDAGTARLLAAHGFAALATTSAGLAFSRGRAARAQPFPFTVTARADNFFHGRPDLHDTVRRLQAFAEAGADVLYAPALPSTEAVRAVCSSLDKPVNVLAAGPLLERSVTELGALGVRRISLGSALPRAALTAVLDAAAELAGPGTFGFARSALGYAESNALLSGS